MAKPDRRTVLLALGLVLAIALTFVFGYRAGRDARFIRWENEPIHTWMSVPFIAHAHHVPPEILYHAIGIEPQPKDRRPLRRIAGAITQYELRQARHGQRLCEWRPANQPVEAGVARSRLRREAHARLSRHASPAAELASARL